MSRGRADAVRWVTIAEAAEVLPGFSTGATLVHDPGGSHQVVLSRHLVPGLPHHVGSGEDFRIVPERDAARYELRDGDVLLMSRGTRNVASWLSAVPGPAIAPVSFYVLRPRPGVESGYLTWYLNEPAAQRELVQIRTGAGTPLIQRAAFAELFMPLPDPATQRRLADLGVLMARERQLLERLANATARAHDATSDQIVRALRART